MNNWLTFSSHGPHFPRLLLARKRGKNTMERLFLLFLLWSTLFAPSLLAAPEEKINFNKNWWFVRLKDFTSKEKKIKNQGNDWASQFSVTHVSSNSPLAIPKEILIKEFHQLESATWEKVTLPHNPVIEKLTIKHQWEGICYYKKSFFVEEERRKNICLLEFEGAMQLADIWINGQHVRQHAGGYTPFVIEVTPYLKFGESNEILVRLDNRSNPLIPPGKPLDQLDFCYHGGLYRDVNLIYKNKIHITHPLLVDEVAGGGVFVTYPEVTDKKAVIAIKTHVSNKLNKKVKIKIIQKIYAINGLFTQRERGPQIATTELSALLSAKESRHFEQSIEINRPRLWSPEAPWLYLLRTEIEKDGQIIDWEERRIGIRRIKFSVENGFEINGEKIRLVGTNRHQEYPYVGNAIPDTAHYRDIYHIKESGFNLVRLGHYIQNEAVLEACDELGVLAIEPIPGWQFFNDHKQFCEYTYRDIRQMIRRDRNHPSIIMWEVILNESWPPKWWKDKAAAIAHAEYPGDQCYTAGDTYGYFGWDVQYNDCEEGFKRPNNSGKPGFIREYYDYEFGGHYSTTRVKRGDSEKALLQNAWNAQWSHNRYRACYPWTSGEAIWSMYDYNRGGCDNICHSGVADIFRINKFSVPFFKSQLDIGTPLPSGVFQPYIFIATFWNKPTPWNKVIVYSNTEEVALIINGQEVARQKPDNGPDSEYGPKELWTKGGHPFDGGNCRHLNHPPFTFNHIQYQPGEIKAVGYINKRPVCSFSVRTPTKPSALEISYFESGQPASINDLLIVYVKVVDEKGTLCVSDSSKITLAVEQGGEIIGPSSINAEAGIASFLVRTNEERQLILKAVAGLLKTTRTILLKR